MWLGRIVKRSGNSNRGCSRDVQRIQLMPPLAPIRHRAVKQVVEALAVVVLQQVA